MIHSNQLAQHIVEGIIKEKQEINAPTWMHQMLKLYQLAPRFLENIFLICLITKVIINYKCLIESENKLYYKSH